MSYCGVCRNVRTLMLADWPQREENLKPGEPIIETNVTAARYPCPACSPADVHIQDYNWTSEHPKELFLGDHNEEECIENIQNHHMREISYDILQNRNIAFQEIDASSTDYRRFKTTLIVVPQSSDKKQKENK